MKKTICFVLVMVLAIMCFSLPVYAEENPSKQTGKIFKVPEVPANSSITIDIGDAEYIDIGDGNLIAVSSLPKGNQAKNIKNMIKNPVKQRMAAPAQMTAPMQVKAAAAKAGSSTHGKQKVASMGVAAGSINLYVEYTTSGAHNTGKITYHNAYSTLSGFTLGFSWKNVTTHSEVTKSGKDIYASCSGQITYYLLVDIGILELGSSDVSLSGYCYAIH